MIRDNGGVGTAQRPGSAQSSIREAMIGWQANHMGGKNSEERMGVGTGFASHTVRA